MIRCILLCLLCLPGGALAHFGFTVDQATGQTGGEIGFTFLTFEDADDFDANLIRAFGEFAAQRQQDGSRLGGYIAVMSASATAVDFLGNTESVNSNFAVELGGTYTLQTSASSALTTRLGMTIPQSGRGEEAAAATLASPARLTDLGALLPETGLARLSISAHGRSGVLVYRFDGGVDFGIAGELGTELDPLVRLNGALGLAVGPAIIGAELVNLINPEESGDDGMLHTFAAGVRADLNGLEPGLAVIAPLDEELADAYGTIIHLSLRGTVSK